MKKLCLSLLTLLLLHSGCVTTGSIPSAEQPVLLRVEFKNGTPLRQTILQLLRSIKVKDLVEKQDGDMTEIEVAYIRSDIPQGRLGLLRDELEELTGVLLVQIRENRTYGVSKMGSSDRKPDVFY